MARSKKRRRSRRHLPVQEPTEVERVNRRFEWTPELVALLGKMTDRALARRIGLSTVAVFEERQSRGIPPFILQRPATKWTRQMIALLGTASDREVSARLGISAASIGRKRRELGIPPNVSASYPSPRERLWSPRELALLGACSDAKVANLLGASVQTVATKRRALRISAYRPSAPRIRWTKKMTSLLGEVSDAEVSRRFAVSEASVKRKRRALGIPSRTHRGSTVVANSELLRLLRLPMVIACRCTNLKPGTIRKLRRQHGIEAPTYNEALRQRYWPPEVLERLGTVEDRILAEELGLTAQYLGEKRRALGIDPVHRWRPAEIELLLANPSNKAVAQKLGRSVHAVASMRHLHKKKARVKRRKPKPPTRAR